VTAILILRHTKRYTISYVSDHLEEALWKRQSNLKSGWSRTLLVPALRYATYDRRWRLVGTALLYAIVSPALFAPSENEDARMTRVVSADHRWTRERKEGVNSYADRFALAALGDNLL